MGGKWGHADLTDVGFDAMVGERPDERRRACLERFSLRTEDEKCTIGLLLVSSTTYQKLFFARRFSVKSGRRVGFEGCGRGCGPAAPRKDIFYIQYNLQKAFRSEESTFRTLLPQPGFH